jgi:hypothetical protein
VSDGGRLLDRREHALVFRALLRTGVRHSHRWFRSARARSSLGLPPLQGIRFAGLDWPSPVLPSHGFEPQACLMLYRLRVSHPAGLAILSRGRLPSWGFLPFEPSRPFDLALGSGVSSSVREVCHHLLFGLL